MGICIEVLSSITGKLIKDKPSYKGKHKLTESMRQKLTKAARCAVIMRSKESNKHKAAALLQEDILNGPLHCFGSHHKCKGDYCKVVQSLEKENTSGNTSQSIIACFDKSNQSIDEANSSTCSADTNASDDSGIFLVDSSGSNPKLNKLSTDSDFTCFENEGESIESFLQDQEAAWHDATSSTTESCTSITAASHTDATTVSLDPPHPIDNQMLCDIRAIASRLASKAHQLLGVLAEMLCIEFYLLLYFVTGNFTTNLAESYMNVRCKFDGGKQINRSQRGSWQGRCAGAGLRLNMGPDWGSDAWEKVTKTAPSATLKEVGSSKCVKVAANRKRKAKETVKAQRKQAKRLKKDENSQQARLDYSRYDGGENAAEIATDLSPQQLYTLMSEFYVAKVKVTESQANAITLNTIGQGSSDDSLYKWLAERRCRITASNAGSIAKRRPTTKVSSTVKQLLFTEFTGNTATRWGILQESSTNEQYLQSKQTESPDIRTTSTGLVISNDHPWLAASPDGLVYDPLEDPPNGVVEFKNPYSVRNLTLCEAAIKAKGFCLQYNPDTNKVGLKKNHDYFYQIQCTMYCTRRKWCDLVVRTKDMYIERVYYDKNFWTNVIQKLQEIYFTAVLPELSFPLGATAIREPSQEFKREWEEIYKSL